MTVDGKREDENDFVGHLRAVAHAEHKKGNDEIADACDAAADEIYRLSQVDGLATARLLGRFLEAWNMGEEPDEHDINEARAIQSKLT